MKRFYVIFAILAVTLSESLLALPDWTPEEREQRIQQWMFVTYTAENDCYSVRITVMVQWIGLITGVASSLPYGAPIFLPTSVGMGIAGLIIAGSGGETKCKCKDNASECPEALLNGDEILVALGAGREPPKPIYDKRCIIIGSNFSGNCITASRCSLCQ